MTDRTTISVRDEVYETLDAHRGDDESWSDYLVRLRADGEETSGKECECTVNALTEEHIDDIAQRTASAVEDRMTRR